MSSRDRSALPIELGSHRQLFLDDYLIDLMDGARRRVCPVDKHPANPLIHPELPWEPRGYVTYGSVLRDEEDRLYKAWCTGVGDNPMLARVPRLASRGVAYFTSDDGIHWDRPALGIHEVADQGTSLVDLWNDTWPDNAPGCYELFGVSKDPGDPDPERRYKLGHLYLALDYDGPDRCPEHPTQRRGLGVAFSADGTHWRTVREPVTHATSDGACYWFYDTSRRKYVLYGRARHFDPDHREKYADNPAYQHHGGRAVRRAESEDFIQWDPDQGKLVLAVDADDGPGDDIYGMNVFPYEGVYIGLVMVLHNYVERCWMDVQLAVSRDSVHFQRLSDRHPFIPVGEVGAWDRFNQSPSNNPPLRQGTVLWFYYSGRSYVHSGAYKGADNGKDAGLDSIAGVGLGTVELDRFAAIEAGFDTGILRTRPLILRGRQLHLNAQAPSGRVDVSVLTPDGDPIDGASSTAKHVDLTYIPLPALSLAGLQGQPVRLEFGISNARLFSFWLD